MSLASLLLASTLAAENPVASTSLTIRNRSGYPMATVLWQNGKDCSQRLLQDAPPIDINSANPPTINVPANQLMAAGVAIYEMRGKSPVVCDYILSFTLNPSWQYQLEYDVHDRRCYGQLFRQEEGVYKLVVSTDSEGLTERFPEFGWDQSEPGCAEQ